MTKQINEKFEATGYDETWSGGETVGSGGSLDEDANPADVSSPANWGTKCLKAVGDGTANGNAYVSDSAAMLSGSVHYFRLEVVVTSWAGNADVQDIIQVLDGGQFAFRLRLYNDSVDNFFLMGVYYDGAYHALFAVETKFNLNTLYRIEVRWDAPADEWEWKINGVLQTNNVDSSYPITSPGTLSSTHATACDLIHLGITTNQEAAATVYYDLVAVDDTTWVGEETAGSLVIPYTRRRIRSLLLR